jgi:fido (protein-threonine AMPylation protein)
VRPIVDLQLTVAKLQAWHKAMFNNVDSFGDKTIGELRDRSLQAGPRLCPSKELAKQALELMCAVVTTWARNRPADQDEVDKTLNIFALAAFAQYHLADIHPFLDGNGGRMGRYVSKHILESTLPLPFPMYDVMDEYVALSASRLHSQSLWMHP